VGLVPLEGIPGLDLDCCRDPETGDVDPWAQQIIDEVGSYSEVSPSGRGVRIFVRGAIPGNRRRKGRFEVYDGKTVAGKPGAILRPSVAAVVVSNPLKTKAIAEAKVKTDKVDAEILAQLLRCDYLPAVWHPDEQTQCWRGLVTHRTALMTQRARVKNHVQSLLGRLPLQPPCKCLWTKAGMAWLGGLELPAYERLVLDSEPRQLRAVEVEVARTDARLAEVARQEPRVRLLMTLPGVNYVVALGLLAALGDVSRFPDGDHAAAYLGLVPSTRQSGRRCYQGSITKAGRSQARWLLTQSAQHVARHPGPLGAFFRRLVKRKNRNVAITAVARKLVTIAFLMLKHNEPYRYARLELMREKFATLQARGAEPDGATRPAKPRAKGKPGLAEVYRAAGLPAVTSPEELPAGEQRMLTERELTEFVAELYQPTAGPSRGDQRAAGEGPRRGPGRSARSSK
jgi:transposase